MTDISHTITAKSDQLNADDLIGGCITIEITKASVANDDQPVVLSYKGDNGKPYKPCKSMRRIIAHAWGTDSKAYAGRAMTLYRDADVQFGGMAVGGIRISHMSDIQSALVIPLSVKRGSKRMFTVKPLAVVAKKEMTDAEKSAAAQKKAKEIIAAIANAQTVAEVEQVDVANADALDRLEANYPALAEDINNHRSFKLETLNQPKE